MKTRKLQAIKPHVYGTRHLIAGEEYEVPLREAVALVVSRKARFHVKHRGSSPAEVPPEKAADIEAPSGSIDALRAQARALGVEVDGRWGTARLQYEIGKAEGT